MGEGGKQDFIIFSQATCKSKSTRQYGGGGINCPSEKIIDL